jgi:hypothetical protein
MKSVLAKLVAIMWVPLLLSVIYTGWVFRQRHSADPPPENPPSRNTSPLAAYGNGLKILQFYAREREIGRGGKALVCYGVVNATALRLDPPVETVWPAVSRCFEVAPARSTRYTLTAEGPDHTAISESIEIAVKQK